MDMDEEVEEEGQPPSSELLQPPVPKPYIPKGFLY
jgi:hypothetical protein